MKFAKASRALGIAMLAACATVPVAAYDDEGGYVGLNLGASRAEIDDERIRAALAQGGFTTTSLDDDSTNVGAKLYGGYRFNRNFALEGGYFDLGDFGFTAQTSPPGSLTGKTEMQGINVDPVFFWPLDPQWTLLGRLGLQFSEADTSYAATGSVAAPPDQDERKLGYKFGVGADYRISPPLSLRAEVERYRIADAIGNDGDIDLLSLGLVYHFARPAAHHAHAQAPAPMPAPAPAPAPVQRPAPVLVTAPAPVTTVKYCSILDIQFEIAQDEIQREEKERLAVVGTFMKKYPDTTAIIEGHSDNVGLPADKQQLSQRRAESVVDYLVNTLKIARSRLTAVGYGDTRPLASNDTQEGQRLNRRIGAVIACARDIQGLTVIPARITMAMDMEFDANKADVKPQYRGELAKVAKFLKANPRVTATVEGHTANLQATPELAMEISQRRAQNVVNYLVTEFAVPRSQLKAEGFGEQRRFAYNTSAEGQQENRRVNIIVNYPK